MIDWPKFPKNLTTFQGFGPGKSAVRSMEMEAGGMGGIRRVERHDPDGTVHVLNTRNGFPEVVTTRRKTAVTKVDWGRTFVFSVFGTTTAVVANRFGAGLWVAVRGLVVGAASYFVSRVRTDSKGKWNDVVRLDGAALKVNSNAPTFLPASIPAYITGGRPYLSATASACADDATRSPLFVLVDGEVSSIGVTGGERDRYGPYGSASAVWSDASADGVFTVYGSSLGIASGKSTQQAGWEKVQVSPLYPYVASLGKGSTSVYPFTATGDDYYKAAFTWAAGTWTVTSAPDGLGGDILTQVFSLPGPPGVMETRVVGYPGSDVEITMSGHATGTGVTTRISGQAPFGGWSSTYSVTHTSKKFGPVISHTSTTSGNMAEGVSDVVATSTASSLDHIFVDVDEGIYLYLRCELTSLMSGKVGSPGYPSPSPGTQVDISASATYLLDIRGTVHEFPCGSYSFSGVRPHSYTAGEWPGYTSATLAGGAISGFTNTVGTYTLASPGADYPRRHGAMFSPAWMSQSDCPFIAYTTRAEELAGAVPEFYLDIRLQVVTLARYGQLYPTIASSQVEYTPPNALMKLAEHLGIGEVGVWPVGYAASNSLVWAGLFPLNTPTRIQFANGVKGSWSNQLGDGFSGDPMMDISRI